MMYSENQDDQRVSQHSLTLPLTSLCTDVTAMQVFCLHFGQKEEEELKVYGAKG